MEKRTMFNDHGIAPSEIIIDKKGTIQEDIFHAIPWIRFIARFFDYALFILVLWGLGKLLHGHLPLGQYESFIPFEFFVWIPIEAFLLWSWGTTPGKFFLNIKFRQGRRLKLGFQTALRRSFNVWLRGLGMMIPVINGICLLVAYYRIKSFGQTSWDRDEHITISHSPFGRWRILFSAFLTCIVLLWYFAQKNVLYR